MPPARWTARPRFDSGPRSFLRRLTDGDQIAHLITLIFAASILLITALLVYQLWIGSADARHKFGWHFFFTSTWDPVAGDFGALPFIYGTLVTSALALIIAVPLGLGAAIFLAELAPRSISDGLAFLIDLLAAVPSVIYGLLGIFIVVPMMRLYIAPFLESHAGISAAISGAVLRRRHADGGNCAGGHGGAVHRFGVARSAAGGAGDQREAAMGLGATRWEATWKVVVPFARTGIFGSVFLALARALGETMAVTMVIGNDPKIAASLFAPGYSIAAVIANEFSEATGNLYVNSLVELGLVLFLLTFILNGLARILILATGQKGMAQGMSFPDGVAKVREYRDAQPHGGVRASSLFRCWFDSWLSAWNGASVRELGFLYQVAEAGRRRGRRHGQRDRGQRQTSAHRLAVRHADRRNGRRLSGGVWREDISLSSCAIRRILLNGVPSIVIGIFAYAVVVMPMKHFSTLAGGFALGIMMIPIAVRSTEEFLRAVPRNLREGAMALGASKWKTIATVIVPAAFQGILTGLLLDLARVAGETAPLLFTAFSNRFWSPGWNQPIASLPVMIFTYAISPYDDWHRQAWAAGLVLLGLVLVINIVSRYVMARRAAFLRG